MFMIFLIASSIGCTSARTHLATKRVAVKALAENPFRETTFATLQRRQVIPFITFLGYRLEGQPDRAALVRVTRLLDELAPGEEASLKMVINTDDDRVIEFDMAVYMDAQGPSIYFYGKKCFIEVVDQFAYDFFDHVRLQESFGSELEGDTLARMELPRKPRQSQAMQDCLSSLPQ